MELDGLFPLAAPVEARGAAATGVAAAALAAPTVDSPLPVRMRPAGLDELG